MCNRCRLSRPRHSKDKSIVFSAHNLLNSLHLVTIEAFSLGYSVTGGNFPKCRRDVIDDKTSNLVRAERAFSHHLDKIIPDSSHAVAKLVFVKPIQHLLLWLRFSGR